jgi:hypothetical protein
MKPTIIILLTIIFLYGCSVENPPRQTTKTNIETKDESSWIGMTFGGKLGINQGTIVIPFDGSSPTIWFWF